MKNKITPNQYAVLLYETTLEIRTAEKAIKGFLEILAKNNDLGKIAEIIREFEIYERKQRGVKDIEIISAKPLTREVKKQIMEDLESEGKIEVKETVNHDLLAGMIVIEGDMMTDGSLSKKLRKLSKSLSHG